MITEKEKQRLTVLLRKHEGNKLQVYSDSLGEPTIGIGRCLSTRGLSRAECDYLKLGTYDKNAVIAKLEVRGITQIEADYLLSNDIDSFSDELYNRIPWIRTLPETARIVLLDMCFNLGITKLMKFNDTLKFIQRGAYDLASKEMLDSTWAKQVKTRAKELSEMLAKC